MNVLLAIETSTPLATVALVRGHDILFESSFSAERSHNSRVFGPLQSALDAGRPDVIAVGTGPGSYSGIRVGLAAAVGLGGRDRQAAADTMGSLLYLINGLKVLFAPFLPHTSARLHELLGFEGTLEERGWVAEAVPAGQALPKPTPLFVKLET